MGTNPMQQAINRAVNEAKSTYQDANKSPADHGFVMVKGIDGRTTLAQALSDHPEIDLSRDDYHGTTLTINGVSRYYAAQRGAYDSFIKTLIEEGIGGAEDLTLFGHRH